MSQGTAKATPILAFIFGLGAVVAIAIELLKFSGPWLWVALFCSALAAAFILGASRRLRIMAVEHEGTVARVSMAENERESLKLELQQHNRLEQALRKAQQVAESAVLAKGEFLATMSHEIRTPLNGIIPMLDLLSCAELQTDQRHMLNTASESSQQLLRIVDDILDYSKLEANKLDLEVTGFNLRDLLDSVLQLMKRPADNKNLRMALQLDPGVRLPVRGDPVRLRQVLSNLVGNAVKFTERGAIVISARRLSETASQHLLRFEVRDTGIGIDEEAQSRLFHSFSQADTSTTRLYGGTGLGLAICKRIVDLMGGRIGAVSELGKGATFWFEIPLLKVIGDMSAQDTDTVQTKILLVTPDGSLRQRLEQLLPSFGMQLSSVETTQEALERLRTHQANPKQRFNAVVGDLSSLRASARALHRGVARNRLDHSADVRMVWLYTDEVIADELRDNSSLLPRQSHGAELQAALSSFSMPEPSPLVAFEPLQLDDVQPSVIITPVLQQKPALQQDANFNALATTRSAPIAQVTFADPSAEEIANTLLLMVEDNPVNSAVGQKLLSVLGYSCDVAPNGQVALEKMATGKYSLVLMDCQMPVMDGYTAAREWRDSETKSRIAHRLPIVAMTANAMAGDRQRCLDAGMDDYLAKPVSRELLDNCLNRWLPGRANFGGSPQTPVTPPLSVDSVPPAAPVIAISTPAPRLEMPNNLPVIDYSMLDELQEIAGEETARIINLFLEDAPRLIMQLEQASTTPDRDVMRDAAHTLKSSSANVGAMALSTAAKRIELGARADKLQRPAVAVALVIAEYARARIALQGYVMQLDRNGNVSSAYSSSLVNR